MKTKITTLLFAAMLFVVSSASAQVPNGGFENWTNGSPDSWFCTNVPTIVTNITQATPPYAGNYGVRGEVIMYSGSPYAPLMSSTDQSLNGFPVSQSYANFSFYYQMNITGTAVFEATIALYDAGNNWVGGGGQVFTAGTINSYTLANFLITYIGSNPVECVIIFGIFDTVATDPPVGNYFIVDEITLSGIASVDEDDSENYFASAFPSPAGADASVIISNAVGGDAELFLYDLKGSVVKKLSAEITPGNFEWKFSVAELPQGIYAVRVVNGKKQWVTRLVKE